MFDQYDPDVHNARISDLSYAWSTYLMSVNTRLRDNKNVRFIDNPLYSIRLHLILTISYNIQVDLIRGQEGLGYVI